MLMIPPVASAGTLQTNVIHCGEALTILKCLPSNSIHCICTSPPYFGLRSYIDNDDPKKALELGLEDTPQAYIALMLAVFAEVRRVLRDDGVLWLNMGDSYANTKVGNTNEAPDKRPRPYFEDGTHKMQFKKTIPPGYKHKDLMLMPHRLAIALQDDGWYVRQDNVWHKPNPMPESVTDRTTRAHEYVFMLTKSARYWYDADGVREVSQQRVWTGERQNPITAYPGNPQSYANGASGFGSNPAGRNLRSVWTIATAPYADAHFATFPPELPRLCIKAGCPEQVCALCGAGWVRVVDVSGGTIGKSWHDHSNDLGVGMTQLKGFSGGVENAKDEHGKSYTRQTIGFKPDCDCDTSDTTPGITLDPFMGSGTVAVVARDLGRYYVGIELNPEYVELAKLRLGQKTRIDHLNEQEPEPLEALRKGDLEIKPLFGEIA